jgi:transketolase
MGESEKIADAAFVEAPFGRALVEVGRSHPETVALTADLGKYTDVHPFRDAYPDRFFNVGMAEQNLVAVAAGMAKAGRLPFCTTYGVFATRRAFDFIAIACAHSAANVKIVAGLPGLTTGYGGTHQAIEDLGLMRLIPGLTVVDPCDATDIMQATAAIADHDGPVYMRLQRANVPVVLDPSRYTFRLGKAALVRDGGDVGIVATGLMTGRALAAAELLAADGVAASVLHMPTIKPFDAEALLELAARVDLLVVSENHVSRGGLYSLVCETLTEARLARTVVAAGLPDRYIECGSLPFLQNRYGLTAERIVAAVRTRQ